MMQSSFSNHNRVTLEINDKIISEHPPCVNEQIPSEFKKCFKFKHHTKISGRQLCSPLYHQQEQELEQVLPAGLVRWKGREGGEMVKKGEYSANTVCTCM
jgi:hypothetical protein